MINSEPLFDHMLTGLLPIAWEKHFSIEHRLNLFLSSLSILHMKYLS